MIGGEADDPRPIIGWHLMENREGAANDHDDREETENEAVGCCNGAHGGSRDAGK